MMSFQNRLVNTTQDNTVSLGLLILRVGIGSLMFFGHGLQKLMNFGTLWTQFSDPIGLGPSLSITLVVFAEAFCALAIILGFYTRLAAIPLVINMSVAFLFVHLSDPFSRMEKSLLFLVVFLAILIFGAGKYSVDQWLRRKKATAPSA